MGFGSVEIITIPVPAPQGDEVLIRVAHYAINPTDWKQVDTSATGPGTVVGIDVAGTVVALGPDATRFKLGDVVAGLSPGNKFKDNGGASEYALLEEEIAFALPAGLGTAEAATWGIGAGTAAQVVFQSLGNAFPVPGTPAAPNGKWFFVSGGSTAVGLFVVQLAKRVGYSVIASASPANFDLVKEYGADAVVDYHDAAGAIAEVERVTGGVAQGAELAGGSSWDISAKVVPEGSLAAIVLGDPTGHAIRSILGYVLKRTKETYSPKDHEYIARFYALVPELISTGEIKSGQVTERVGIDAVPAGLAENKAGVSGTKIVVRIAQ
ncbi:hypothetical protein Q8F55_005804 [Vanrija albida]|uniref:Enoyl reductase (ER) domain-containing protein n=1 Tax=Vanrija albida TaxID=181172 RepID=A0ABR3Q2M1_9TREE